VTIPYYPLSDAMLDSIVRLQLGRIARRLQDSQGVPFTYDDAVAKLVASRCTELESGGRMVDAVLTNSLLPRMSQELLQRTLAGREVGRVHVGVEGGDFTYAFE
jgi:type VI secretion system protein VasG